MKKLLLLVIVAAAAWYGWKQWPTLMQKVPGHEAVVVNDSGHEMTRVRLKVDGQTFVEERLADGERTEFEFKVADDSDLALEWQYADMVGDFSWKGGLVPKGPLTQRHRLTVDADHGVLLHSEPRLADTK